MNPNFVMREIQEERLTGWRLWILPLSLCPALPCPTLSGAGSGSDSKQCAAYKIFHVHYDIQDLVFSFAACTPSIRQYKYSTSRVPVSMKERRFITVTCDEVDPSPTHVQLLIDDLHFAREKKKGLVMNIFRQ
jgi:hypothetical protein